MGARCWRLWRRSLPPPFTLRRACLRHRFTLDGPRGLVRLPKRTTLRRVLAPLRRAQAPHDPRRFTRRTALGRNWCLIVERRGRHQLNRHVIDVGLRDRTSPRRATHRFVAPRLIGSVALAGIPQPDQLAVQGLEVAGVPRIDALPTHALRNAVDQPPLDLLQPGFNGATSRRRHAPCKTLHLCGVRLDHPLHFAGRQRRRELPIRLGFSFD